MTWRCEAINERQYHARVRMDGKLWAGRPLCAALSRPCTHGWETFAATSNRHAGMTNDARVRMDGKDKESARADF